MTDAAAEMTPGLTNICCLSGNVRHLSRMLYMEDIIQQKNHTVNEQLKLLNAANDMARAAMKKHLRQRFSDLEKVLELERESGELSSKLKDAESEMLMLKYYISEENITRINKYIEASELLTNRVRRDLLERDSQLRRMEEVLVTAWGRLRNLPQSEQDVSSRLLHLSSFFTDSGQRVPCRCELDGQWDKLEKALKTKEEEIAYLQHLLRDQKEEMEMKWAALEEKLLRQTKDGESHARHLCDKDQSIRKKFSDIKSHVMNELFEKEEHQKKELSDINKDLSGELSERCEQFRKELSQKEEGLKMKVLQLSKKELSERNKNIRTELCERQDGLAQRRDVLEKELVESTNKHLSESEEQFQKELSAREKDFNKNFTKEQFTKELSERNDSFKKELCEKAEDFREELLQMEERLKKEPSERKDSFMKKLPEREKTLKMETSEKYTNTRELARRQEKKQEKMKRLINEKDKSSNPAVTENHQEIRPSSVPRSDITQQITALSIWTGPEEKEVIQVEDLVRVAQMLKQQDREDYETQLEEIARSGQDQLEKLRMELENKFLEASQDGKRQVEQKLKEKHMLRERLKAVESFLEQNKEQVKKVTELKRKQEEVRNAGWTVLQELTQKTQILDNLERNLIVVQRQILDKTESELKDTTQSHGQLSTRALQDLSECMKRYNKSLACRCEATGQWDKLEEALRRKDEEITSLYRRVHAQKKEMEEELAALEGKLHHQLKEQEERHQQTCTEKEDVFEKNVNESEECFRKELTQMEEHFRKELIEKHKYFRKELSKRHGQFRKELLEKEEGTEKKILKIATKEVAERDKKFEKELLERQDKFRKEVFQKEKSLKNEVLERVKKELYKKEDDFRKELSKMEEHFNKQASERKKSFRMELSELEDEFKKKLSERHSNFMKELFKREETFEKEISEKHGKVSEQQIKEPRSITDREQKLEQEDLRRSGTQQIPDSTAADTRMKVSRHFPDLE